MGLFVPNNPSFGYMTGNVLGVQPAAAMGTVITPGASNSYGSYTEVLSDASVTRDCYGILINFNSGNFAAEARDTIVTIGIDSAGGISYVDWINHLLAPCSSNFDESGGGYWYYFPIFIKSGSAIAAKASVNHATARTINCCVTLYGAPKNISGLVYGHGVETIGAVTASSAGTAVTPGTTSEGAWTSLGTATKKWKFVQYGMGVNDAAMAATKVYLADLSFGDGTNQVLLDQDKVFMTFGTAEKFSGQLREASYCDVPISQGIYGRIQGSTAPETNLSMAAYGVY